MKSETIINKLKDLGYYTENIEKLSDKELKELYKNYKY